MSGKQTVNGEDAVMMVMEMIQDVDDEALAKALSATIGKPVKVTSDDTFEIDWNADEESIG